MQQTIFTIVLPTYALLVFRRVLETTALLHNLDLKLPRMYVLAYYDGKTSMEILSDNTCQGTSTLFIRPIIKNCSCLLSEFRSSSCINGWSKGKLEHPHCLQKMRSLLMSESSYAAS
jgi:hypothetical protein